MPSYKIPSSLRHQKFALQSGRCFYCGFPMWESNPEHFAAIHNVPPKVVKGLKCTAEHLHARCDGGGDTFANIAAACLVCNQRRHQRKKVLEPAPYAKLVRQRIAQKKWHPIQAYRLLPH